MQLAKEKSVKISEGHYYLFDKVRVNGIEYKVTDSCVPCKHTWVKDGMLKKIFKLHEIEAYTLKGKKKWRLLKNI